MAEKTKAQEEAEDLTQEMAELRYQLMEMIEQERELRAQTEQASVLRVEELEAQVSYCWTRIQPSKFSLFILQLWLPLTSLLISHVECLKCENSPDFYK